MAKKRSSGTSVAVVNNGNGRPKYDTSELIANAIQTRGELLKTWMDPRRDIDKECGYPDTSELTAERFKQLYDREPIAERVVKVMPNECWNVQPTIVEDEDSEDDTAFEKAWKELGQKINGHSYHQDAEGGTVWDYLRRVDVLSGIGHFGVLLLGFDDGKNLQEPVEGAMQYATHNANPEGCNQHKPCSGSGGSSEQKFKEMIAGMSRSEKLKLLRQGGFTAHKINTDEGLTDALLAMRNRNLRLTQNQRQTIYDCYLTNEEEQTLLALPNLNEQEKVVINQLSEQRKMVLNASKKEGSNIRSSKDGTASGEKSGYSGIRQGDVKAPGVTGTDQQYDTQYGALSPFNLMGSLAGTDQQYFGIQFGASELPSDKPAEEGLNLLFIRPFDESLVQIVRYEWNVRNPRFGQPVMYRITLNDPREQHSGIGLPMATVFVHWSRVIHVADNLNSSEIFGVPRMRPVLNRLLNLLKIYGGDAEGYWRGAIPGLSLETHPQLGGDVTIDQADMRRQVENFYNGLQRALGFTGMSAKTLAPSVVDPSSHVDKQIEAICIALAIPKRVFMGSERGELASSQDDAAWNDRLKGRQNGYLTPRVIVPFIDRLISVGVLPEPKAAGNGPRQGYTVRWPDLDSNTERDKAGIALVKTQAMGAFVAGNVEAIMPLQDWYVRVLGMSKEEAKEVIEGAEDQVVEQMEYGESTRLTPDPSQQGGGGFPGQEEAPQVDEDGNPVDEDGQPIDGSDEQTENAFCPTGPGGGHDNSCGSSDEEDDDENNEEENGGDGGGGGGGGGDSEYKKERAAVEEKFQDEMHQFGRIGRVQKAETEAITRFNSLTPESSREDRMAAAESCQAAADAHKKYLHDESYEPGGKREKAKTAKSEKAMIASFEALSKHYRSDDPLKTPSEILGGLAADRSSGRKRK